MRTSTLPIPEGHARALGFVLLSLLCAPGLVHAHGAPPRALCPLLADAAGVSLVQLSSGLAQRHEQGYVFLCPALWGGDEVAPSASFDDERAVVAARNGLFWVDTLGPPHASTIALAGVPLALAKASDGLYVLTAEAGSSSLQRIAAASEPVWSATAGQLAQTSWLALDASDAQLLLVGTRDQIVEQLLLDHAGNLVSHATAPWPSAVLSVQAHLTEQGPYLTLATDDGQLTLARFEQDGIHALRRAAASLAGPVQSASGALLVAIDGALFTLELGVLTQLAASAPITGLSRLGGASYASVHSGLCLVDRDGCSRQVFDFAQLTAPDLTNASDSARAACLAEWQHLQVDLSAAGLLPADVAVDAGASVAGHAADAGDAELAATPAHVGDTTPDAGGAPPRAGSGGCAVAPRGLASPWLVCLALWWGRSRRRRRSAR
ncbi:MAG: hypothetical protein JWN04_2521 [Myxococcaceae bacterium]|nr:hypothetical protein [Myxococcaceae bacterium]